MKRRTLWASAVLLSGASAACSGDLEANLDPTLTPQMPVMGAGGAMPTMVAMAGAAGTAATTNMPNAPQVAADGTIVDMQGRVLCNPALTDCSAFQAGGYQLGYHDVGRLSVSMYNNTVRDLFGTSLTPADDFPVDEQTLGFDNIAAGLNVQPEHIEAYMPAAEDLVAELFARPATDPIRTALLPCDYTTGDAACQSQILTAFATKAWRRPVTAEELALYTPLLAQGPEVGLQAAMTAIVLSPRFMYLVETDPAPADPAADPTAPHPLNDYELATRLSYFLWNTMPDDQLTAAAAAGLNDDAALQAQVDRMLVAPGRVELITEFATQWLNVNKVRSVLPEVTVYPNFDLALRDQMVGETQALLMEFFDQDLPMSQLFTANFTFLTGALAQYYGIPGVTGEQMQKVTLDPATTHRLGILTQGSYLVGTSNPTRTSPVKRGKFVLDRLLCAPLPPPPPGVPTIDEGSGLENLSLRERLAQHQQKGPACANCHKAMDAIGLGLENFDGVAAYRNADEFGPIDPSGTLDDSAGNPVPFAGVEELAAFLASDPRVGSCVTEKLLTYGLRQDFAPAAAVKQVITAYAALEGGSLTDTIRAIVMSDVFRYRRAAAMPAEGL